MANTKRIGDLEINQDLEFQKKEWTAERVGWVLIALIVLAGLLGLLGPGPISDTTLENGPLKVTYYRIDRLLAPSSFEVEVGPESVADGELRLQLSKELVEAVELKQVVPEPDQVQFKGDTLIYIFSVEESNRPLKVIFHHQPDEVGVRRGSIGIENGPEVDMTYFVLP